LQANAAANGAASASATTVVLTPDNTRSADFGLWLSPVGGTLTVADIATSGPIAGLGLQLGDAIVSINGQAVSTEQQFVQQLLADNVRNQQIDLVVARGGVNQTVQLMPSNLIQGMIAADPLFLAGLVLDPASSNQFVVQRVFPRTAAFRAGLRSGDVITSVGGQRIATAADLNRALTVAGTAGVPLQVTRAGRPRGLMFTPTAGVFSQQTSGGVQAPGTLITGGVNVPRTAAGTAAGAAAANPAAAAAQAGVTAPQAGVAAPTAIAPPNRAGTGARTGTLFPNSALPTPATAAPGSTQRVPVVIPGATNPPAGNPVVPAGAPAGNPIVPGGAPAGNPIAPGAAPPAAGGP
jgi:membrane-associated protease RseP (regulator of RpoE activity)